MQAIVTPAKYYLADYNLGEIKHQAMFAGGLHHQSYYKYAWWVPLKPGSLVASFRFTRNLPHGFNLIFVEGIKKIKVEQILPKATKKSA